MAFRMNKDAARELAKTSLLAPIEKSPSQTRDVRRAIVNFRTVDDYVHEIETLWTEAAESFLLIGRWLNQAKEALAHGEFQRMVEQHLPFDKSRAYQLRMVALMIDSGRVAEPDLPRSSSTAFLFASLDEKMLIRAKHEGILRPDARRSEVQAWKRRLLTPNSNSQANARIRRLLQAKIQRYETQIARAREQLAELGPDNAGGSNIDGEPATSAAVDRAI